MTPILEVEDLGKSYGGFEAVRHLSFALARGEVLGFLGPNGAGKTSTLRMILGILKPDRGSVRLFGQAWSRALLPRIGYLPEERGLYRRMKAAEAIAYFARLRGLDRAAARRSASALLERLGLAEAAGKRIESLSKGMAQKVQLAAAIAHGPELLILDEPFTGLDPLNQQAIEGLIRERAAAGCAVLFSTHTMQHAERLCRRILILRRGEKAFDGSIEESRRLLPRRVRLEASEDLSFIAGLAGVSRLEPPGPGRPAWEALLAGSTEPGAVLAACLARGIMPYRFDAAGPSLHEVFVAIAGSDAAAEADAA
ncbi:MAG TPA: ATP-binding cassette domain-containing protein [Dongiaceae bacterium]|nr:ATP-binding cassette domain-containing protein [Dongiaceae bacterium]